MQANPANPAEVNGKGRGDAQEQIPAYDDEALLPAWGWCRREPARLCPCSVLLPAYAPDFFYYLV